MMKKKLLLGFILILIGGLFFFKFISAQRQSTIGLKLNVFEQGFYSSAKIQVQDAGAENNIYKIPPQSVVLGNTEYELILEGVGTATFTLEFSASTGGTPQSFSGMCSQFYGKLVNNRDCIIIGSFNTTSNPQKWTITLKKDNFSTSTSFYLTKTSTSTLGSHLYYLEPTSITTIPGATNSYRVYSNKLYCPSTTLPDTATSKILPSDPSTPFIVSRSDFISPYPIISILKNLVIGNNASPGDYTLRLVSPGNIVSNSATITIQAQQPPPAVICPGVSCYRCVLGVCHYFDSAEGRWRATSTKACKNVGLDCRAITTP